MGICMRILLKNLFIGASWIFFSFGGVLLTVAGASVASQNRKELVWISSLVAVVDSSADHGVDR